MTISLAVKDKSVHELMNVVGDDGRAPARPGYDHGWFDFEAMPAREALRLPGEATLVVSVVLDIGAVEWEQPPDSPVVPPTGGRGLAPYPDFPRMSHREFGHRVGVFRVLEMLGRLDIAPAAVVDVLTAEHYPALMSHLVPAAGEIIAGGLSASRPITSQMSEEEESHYIGTTMDRLKAALGFRPIGWSSPERCESFRTPALLADAGLHYVTDWANDDQPYPMPAAEPLWSFPLSWELSDVSSGQLRGVEPDVWARSLVEAADVLRDEGVRSARVLGVHLAPWSVGQPYRAGAVAEALEHLRTDERTWWATPAEVVAWWREPHGGGATRDGT